MVTSRRRDDGNRSRAAATGVEDVDDSTLTRALYSTDASLYRVVPRVVVRPRHVDEVLAVVEACATTGVPITARGAGTSIAGNSVGAGVVVDFAKHLNRIHAIDPEARTATVDPGVVHASLQRAAAPHGLRYGPDPSSHTRCTVGGMIGNNACGNRALGYGRSADNIAGLDVVTAAGERLTLGRDVAPASPTLERLRTRRLRRAVHRAHRDGHVRPPGVRLQPRAPAARTRLRRRLVHGRHRGHPRRAARRHRRPGAGRQRAAPRGARLPEHGRGRRRRADDAAVRARGLRGAQRPRRRGLSDGSRRRLGPGPAGRRRLPLRRAGRGGCRRAGGHRGAGGRRIGRPGAPSRRRARRAGRPVAGPRGGRGAGRAGPRSSGAVRLGGRRRAAGQPRRLSARLRRADGAASRARRSRTATSATAACTSASTSRSTSPAATPSTATSSPTRPASPPRTAGRSRASTATDGRGPSCCR